MGEDFNITTSTPAPNTTVHPDEDIAIKIYILPVNEKSFYDNSFASFINELQKLANEDLCNLITGLARSCRTECHMSEDPDRGCISVTVDLVDDPLYCALSLGQFEEKVRDQVCSVHICGRQDSLIIILVGILKSAFIP